MAVGRYDARRAAVVDEANAIGTTYLRAQTLGEPVRTESLDALVHYTDAEIRLAESVPGSDAAEEAIAEGGELQRTLWGLAGDALAQSPTDSAPRLYVETLNEMIDMQTVRVSGLQNRVPTAVLVIEIIGASIALGLLALYSPSSPAACSASCWRPRSSRCSSSSRSISTDRPAASSRCRRRLSWPCARPWSCLRPRTGRGRVAPSC
jgi:hypothetical protein